MAALLDSIDRFLANRTRLAMSRHPIYPDWIAEIPEPMFRQLLREGLFRSMASGCVAVIMLLAVFYWLPHMAHKPIAWSDTALQIGVVLVSTVLIRLSGGVSPTQCVERECLYRRLHGKWRWER